MAARSGRSGSGAGDGDSDDDDDDDEGGDGDGDDGGDGDQDGQDRAAESGNDAGKRISAPASEIRDGEIGHAKRRAEDGKPGGVVVARAHGRGRRRGRARSTEWHGRVGAARCANGCARASLGPRARVRGVGAIHSSTFDVEAPRSLACRGVTSAQSRRAPCPRRSFPTRPRPRALKVPGPVRRLHAKASCPRPHGRPIPRPIPRAVRGRSSARCPRSRPEAQAPHGEAGAPRGANASEGRRGRRVGWSVWTCGRARRRGRAVRDRGRDARGYEGWKRGGSEGREGAAPRAVRSCLRPVRSANLVRAWLDVGVGLRTNGLESGTRGEA